MYFFRTKKWGITIQLEEKYVDEHLESHQSYWEKNHVKDYVIETDQNDSENDFEIRVQIKKRGIVSTKYSMYNI
jgi:KaiC/GvpD/RAD55 family RecA-like ATPase